MKRYDDLGQRVTSCCGCYSTYQDEYLVCKKCYAEVGLGEGDGSEFAEGVDPDEYYKAYHAREEVESLKRTGPRVAEILTNLLDDGEIVQVFDFVVNYGPKVWEATLPHLSEEHQKLLQAQRDKPLKEGA